MQQYNVTGMSCAACSARVEKAVGAVPGVSACSVSLLTNSMGVEGTADEKSIIAAVEAAGYGASPKGAQKTAEAPDEDPLIDRETPVLKKRLFSSLGFLALLMYLSMGHNMAGFPVPAFLENHVAVALTQMLIAIVVMLINKKFFTSGFRSLFHGAPNMDTLVALGSVAAFGYSLVELILDTGRTHQIRIHLAALGHPVVGDHLYCHGDPFLYREVYGDPRPPLTGEKGPRMDTNPEVVSEIMGRQALHAFSLDFIHPVTGKEMHLEADLPDDMKNALKRISEPSGGN